MSKYKRILYAGTFDPPTNGHLDIIRRGSMLGGELIIGVLNNPSKTPFFNVEDRLEMVRAVANGFDNVSVDSFDGLLADYVRINDIYIVLRGLRTGADFEHEQQMAQINAVLCGREVETVLLMTDPALSFVSSSAVREILLFGGDIANFVPPEVKQIMDLKKR